MRRTILLLITILAVTFYSAGVGLSITSAATAPTTGQALEIAPPVIYLTGDPGETITTKILLRDITRSKLVVTGEANDFVASGEDGTPKLILDDSTETAAYSIKDWVNPPASLTLVPREIKTMNITIKIPDNASPGGHYGVIRFTATPPGLEGTGVSLSASLGSLILLTVNGDITEQLTVKEFSTNKDGGKPQSIFESTPINFVTRLENTGNNHVQPTGQIEITNMFGKKIAAVNVNAPPKTILPQSIRKFDAPLDKAVIGNKRLFGRYKANLKMTYGSENKVITSSLTFWVIPYRLIAGVIIGLIALFFLLRFAIRRYNRYILNRSQKNKR